MKILIAEDDVATKFYSAFDKFGDVVITPMNRSG